MDRRAKLTRTTTTRAMGKHTEQTTAARQFYADTPRPKSALEVCEAETDDPREHVIDEWAERLSAGGVARLLAQQCAAVVVGVLIERDQGVASEAEEAMASASRGEMLEGLRMLAIKQYQAPKPRLSAGCLLLAMGEMHPDFKSSRELAERQHVSHELAANGVEDWQEILGLPRTSGQKSAAAVKRYQDTNGKSKRAA